MLFYIQTRYPYYSQTFVSQEVEYFRKKRPVYVFSLQRPILKGFYLKNSREFKLFFRYLIKIMNSSISWKEMLQYLYSLIFGTAAGRVIKSGDTIRTHLPKFNGLAALMATGISGARMIPVFHSYALFTHNPFLSEICSASFYTETISSYNAGHLKKFTNKIKVIHCGISESIISKERKDRGKHLLYAGRLHPTKGIKRIFTILQGTGLTLRLAGGGDVAQYSRMAIKFGIEAIFSGKLTHDELLGEMDRAAMLILPSSISSDGDRDGIPVVLMEAMARGLPVLTTRVSGIPELVEDGRSGFFISSNDDARKVIKKVVLEGAPVEIIQAAQEKIRKEFLLETILKKKEESF